MQSSKWIAAALTLTMLTACTEPNGAPGRGVENGGALNKTDVGTAIGAVGGGILGSTIGGGAGQVVAVLGGALLGGILGNQIGHSMDRRLMRPAIHRMARVAMIVKITTNRMCRPLVRAQCPRFSSVVGIARTASHSGVGVKHRNQLV